jgi:hypothetical protein
LEVRDAAVDVLAPLCVHRETQGRLAGLHGLVTALLMVCGAVLGREDVPFVAAKLVVVLVRAGARGEVEGLEVELRHMALKCEPAAQVYWALFVDRE